MKLYIKANTEYENAEANAKHLADELSKAARLGFEYDWDDEGYSAFCVDNVPYGIVVVKPFGYPYELHICHDNGEEEEFEYDSLPELIQDLNRMGY